MVDYTDYAKSVREASRMHMEELVNFQHCFLLWLGPCTEAGNLETTGISPFISCLEGTLLVR